MPIHYTSKLEMEQSDESLLSHSDYSDTQLEIYPGAVKTKTNLIRRILSSATQTQIRVIYCLCVILFLGVAVIVPGYLALQTSSISSPSSTNFLKLTSCGNSTTEAKANGCVLDFIAGAWVHPKCFDQELEREFLALTNWQWFTDAERQNEISFDHIKETGGPNPIYVSIQYHDFHCGYTWRKFHRAVINRVPIDTHIGAYDHTVHCSNALAAPRRTEVSKFFQIFTSCKMAEDYELDRVWS